MENQIPDTPMAPDSDTEVAELRNLIDAKRREQGLVIRGGPQVDRFAEAARRISEIPAAQPPEGGGDQEAEKRGRNQIMGQLLRDAGGERFYRCSFAHYVTATPLQVRVLEACKEFASTIKDRLSTGDNLLLYGPVGTGKDHLAFAVCWQAVMAGDVDSAGWINGQSWFGRIRDAMDEKTTEESLIQRELRPDVLVISDPQPPIGVLTQHQASMLYRLVDARYCERKTTIITINVPSDEEADKRIGAAIWDRMNDRAWKLHCNWPSARKPAREVK